MPPHYSLGVVIDILTVRTDISHRNSKMYETTYGEGVTFYLKIILVPSKSLIQLNLTINTKFGSLCIQINI